MRLPQAISARELAIAIYGLACLTLEVIGATFDANCERAVVRVVDSDDGLLKSDAAAARPTLHLVLRLHRRTEKSKDRAVEIEWRTKNSRILL